MRYLVILCLIPWTGACDASEQETNARTADLSSRQRLDGTVSSTGDVQDDGSVMTIGVADDGAELRGFMSFDLDNLDGANDEEISQELVIRQASLNVFQNDARDQPFDDLGSAVVEVVHYGDELDAKAFDATVVGEPIELATSPSNRQFHFADVTAAAQAWAELQPQSQRLQMRIRFEELDGDGQWDLNTAEASDPSASRPTLTLVYRTIEN